MSSSSSATTPSAPRNAEGLQCFPDRMQEVIFYLKGSSTMHKGRVLTFAKKPTKVLWKCDACQEIFRTSRVEVWQGSDRTISLKTRANSEY